MDLDNKGLDCPVQVADKGYQNFGRLVKNNHSIKIKHFPVR